MSFKVLAEIREFAAHALGGGEKILRMTSNESQAVAQVEPQFTELARAGRIFYGGAQNGATGVAPTTALPTTTASLGLRNLAPVTSKRCIIPLRAHLFTMSGTPAVGATLMAALGWGPAVVPAAAASYLIGSASQTPQMAASVAAQGSTARFTTGETLQAAPVWMGLMSNLQPATANIGIGDQPALLDGLFLIPPGGMLALAVLTGAGTTPTYGVHLAWAELDIEGLK